MSSEGRCMYCGGKVDAHGMSEGGEVPESGEFEVPDAVNAEGETTQMLGQERDDRMAERRFIRAVKGRR